MDPSHYVFPNDQPVVTLDCEVAFKNLTLKEKLYAHYLSQASWYGGLIVLVQTSPESPAIFVVLHRMFRAQPLDELKQLALGKCQFTEEEFKGLLVYSSGLYNNMGNYKGFGDSKFVPKCPSEKLDALVRNSKAFLDDPVQMEKLWNGCKELIYSLTDRQKQLGLHEKGISTYFSDNCLPEDAEKIQAFLKHKSLDPYNTRAFKKLENHQTVYEVRLASVEGEGSIMYEEDFQGSHFIVTLGDYSPLLALVVENLKKAQEYAANATEQKMLEEYIKSFTTGSLPAHKEGSRFWIKDKGPVIEMYIGFIETYRDPTGMRGEFEGFVAMVNKEMTKKFSDLVANAEAFLPLLPWPKEFEMDKFLKPDFTSLDVLTFSGSGIPAGINIPNYDEIRQNEGFKNVSLGNVIPAAYKDTEIPFLSKSDQNLMEKHRVTAFEVQVGLHELLGHGSGKLFKKDMEGKLNFNIEEVMHPETGEKITSWYQPGETYDSVFTSMGSAYEECRAECVGMYLCLNNDVMKIFGHEGDVGGEVKYVNWLSEVWSGFGKALEMYQPKTKAWLQAHSQARYVILRVLLEAGQGLLTITPCTGSDGEPDLLLTLDRSKIDTVGKKALGDFLRKLQVYKSTADIASARAMFNKYSEVPDDGPYPFGQWINIALARKKPRKMFVQANTFIHGDDVPLKTYDASHEGLLQSWVDRFPTLNIDDILSKLWEKEQLYFQGNAC